ncbi:MAG: hypothetical protein KDC34_17860 [Saprospiraceae bacterium]|nr:hypothetical protein [Saprospiraceae bacterium]
MCRLNKYKTQLEALNALSLKGYKSDFRVEDGKFILRENKKKYNPGELKIVEYHRFEGMSNPADSSVVFAILAADGHRGILTSAYGTYSDPALMELLEKIQIKRQEAGQ